MREIDTITFSWLRNGQETMEAKYYKSIIQRKMLEILRVNVNTYIKRKRIDFYRKSKNISAFTALFLQSPLQF